MNAVAPLVLTVSERTIARSGTSPARVTKEIVHTYPPDQRSWPLGMYSDLLTTTVPNADEAALLRTDCILAASIFHGIHEDTTPPVASVNEPSNNEPSVSSTSHLMSPPPVPIADDNEHPNLFKLPGLRTNVIDQEYPIFLCVSKLVSE